MEFYNDDVVLFVDEQAQLVHAGTVTRRTASSAATIFPPVANHVTPVTVSGDAVDVMSVDNSDDDDDDGDDDDDELYDAPQIGQVNVDWYIPDTSDDSTATATIYPDLFKPVPSDRLTLHDRNFMLASVVKHVDSGRVGQVTGVHLSADVELLGYNKVLLGVDCSQFTAVEPFSDGTDESYIVYGDWLGQVADVFLDIIIRFPDGAKLRVRDDELSNFERSPGCYPHVVDAIYEGAIWRGDLHDLHHSKSAKFLAETPNYDAVWLSRLKKPHVMDVVVEKVTVASVEVEWLANRSSAEVEAVLPPTTLRSTEIRSLRAVNPFPWHHCLPTDVWYYRLRIGDRLIDRRKDEPVGRFLYLLRTNPVELHLCTTVVPPSSSAFPCDAGCQNSAGVDVASSPEIAAPPDTRSATRRHSGPLVRRRQQQSSVDSGTPSANRNHTPQRANRIRRPTVQWEDEHQISSADLLSGGLCEGARVPVVIILVRTMVDVTWQDGSVQTGIPGCRLIPQLFSIDEHEFFPGDFVTTRVAPTGDLSSPNGHPGYRFGSILGANTSERVCKVQWFNVELQANGRSELTKLGQPEEVGVYDIIGHTDHQFRLGEIALAYSDLVHSGQPAGYIVGSRPSEGQLEILWTDGQVTSVHPTDLLVTLDAVVASDIGSEDEEDDTEDLSSEDSEWETESEQSGDPSDEDYKTKIRSAADILNRVLTQVRNLHQLFVTPETVRTLLANAEGASPDTLDSFRGLGKIRERLQRAYSITGDVRIKRMWHEYRPKDLLGSRELQAVFARHGISELHKSRSIAAGETSPATGTSSSTTDEAIKEAVDRVCRKLMDALDHLECSLRAWLENCGVDVPQVEASEDAASVVVPAQNLQHAADTEPEKQEQEGQMEVDAIPSTEDSIASLLKSPTIDLIPFEQRGLLVMQESAPASHKFYSLRQPAMTNSGFTKAWKHDMKLLSTSLPRGVIIKSYDDRSDLFSLMVTGPAGTPYQHSLFFFDLQLGSRYPNQPPSVHYISLAPDRVNPNLYVEGRVCLSLLGTWSGRGTENWDPKTSNLLQLIVSIQGLILVAEPYYNEAGFEQRRGTQDGRENSRKYNEAVITAIAQSMGQLVLRPGESFRDEIGQHFREVGQRYVKQLKLWASLTTEVNAAQPSSPGQSHTDSQQLPEFPLAPVTRGFQVCLQRHIESLELILTQSCALSPPPP